MVVLWSSDLGGVCASESYHHFTYNAVVTCSCTVAVFCADISTLSTYPQVKAFSMRMLFVDLYRIWRQLWQKRWNHNEKRNILILSRPKTSISL